VPTAECREHLPVPLRRLDSDPFLTVTDLCATDVTGIAKKMLYEISSPLGCDVIWVGKYLPKFRRSIKLPTEDFINLRKS
jgi:hypothetical protein